MLQDKQANLNQIIRLNPHVDPIILTGGNGCKAFNHPFNRDSFPDDDLGFRAKHEQAGAWDFLEGELVFTERADDWVFTTFHPYVLNSTLVRIDQLKDQGSNVSATNIRWEFQGRIFRLPQSGAWNTLGEITLPFRIFQAAYSVDDVAFKDVTTDQNIVWETAA